MTDEISIMSKGWQIINYITEAIKKDDEELINEVWQVIEDDKDIKEEL